VAGIVGGMASTNYYSLRDLNRLQRCEVRAEYRQLRFIGVPAAYAKGVVYRLVRALIEWGD
jgi:hypothetical protein